MPTRTDGPSWRLLAPASRRTSPNDTLLREMSCILSASGGCLINLMFIAKGRVSMASEPRDRSAPTPFDFAQGAVSESRTAKRRARARVGESEGRSSSE